MLKKIAVVLMLFIVPAFVFAADDLIGKDHWSYKNIKELSESGIITMPLEKDSLTRAEVVDYINNGVNNVLYAAAGDSSSGGSDLMGKINKLYDLVKAYMTDMMRTEKKLDDILNTIGDLSAKKKEIEMKQDKLLNSIGMRINGESNAYMTDLLLFGNQFQSAGLPVERVRPITQYVDLKFSLRARKDLYAEATFRLENMFGGFWGSKDVYGLRRFFIQGDMPVSFVFGDFQGKQTPFTLWAVDDERPFEAKVFADKRDMNKNELYLLDNSWPLNGGKLQTIVELFDSVDVNMMVLGARLGESNKPGYGGVTYVHDRYMIGGRIATDFSLKDMLEVGVNYNEITDAKDTGTQLTPAQNLDPFRKDVFNNYVISGDGLFKYQFGEGDEDGYVKVLGEFAKSMYTPKKGKQWAQWYYDNATYQYVTKSSHHYAEGTAIKAGIEANYFNTTVEISYKNVGNSFTAYASQTRIYNEGDNFGYLTQNNTWNINPGVGLPPAYTIGGEIYPFTMYNPVIVLHKAGMGIASIPNYINGTGVMRSGNLLYYPLNENATNPYGDSTPNRSGIRIGLKGDYFDGMISPKFNFEMASEPEPFIKNKPKNFSVIEFGAKAEYWQLAVMGGIKMESVKNDAVGNSKIAYDSMGIDLGLEYQIIKKKLLAYFGFKSNVIKGTDSILFATAETPSTLSRVPMPRGVASFISERYDHTITSLGGGVEFKVAKPVTMGIYFTNTLIEDNRTVKTAEDAIYYGEPIGTKFSDYNSYNAQELGAKISILF
ncbi:MAG: hypothetical protein CVV21_12035 [Candidatus Goldiibacteriota bacterium HGW-Goldbacteria-1]|jgi:hypothetical protein|nr:MAG: hypothetical protein CVV21_12035 [Candidatus Goldiibacteriota bacterium HGW-Goldbacteria-1]